MRLAPESKEDWVNFALLPAKVFLVAEVVLVILNFPMLGVQPAFEKVFWACFSLCLPVLLLGALVQGIFCKRGAATRTLLFLAGTIAAVALGLAAVVFVPLGWLAYRFLRSRSPRRVMTDEPFECLECHAAVPVGRSRCPTCGWTFNA